MITSDYGRSASDTPHPRTPAAQLQLAGVSATSSRIGAVQVSAYVHTTSPHRLCAQVPTPINFDDPDIPKLALDPAATAVMQRWIDRLAEIQKDMTEAPSDLSISRPGNLNVSISN